MRTEPLIIPELGYPIQVETNVWTGRRRLFAGDTEVPTDFGRFTLADARGQSVSGQILRLRIWHTNPRVKVGDTIYRTGPEAPLALKVLAYLPVLLVFIGGLPGASLGVAGALVNLLVMRYTTSTKVIVATCIGTLLLGAVVLFAIAGVVGATQFR